MSSSPAGRVNFRKDSCVPSLLAAALVAVGKLTERIKGLKTFKIIPFVTVCHFRVVG